MLELKRTNTLYHQIASYFEKEIREGRLKQGHKFPPTTELSKQFKVNPDTIQQSLKILMNQGLIDRAPKRGTFVREAFFGNTLGIVFGKEIFQDNNLLFFPLFLAKLLQYTDMRGWKSRIFMTTSENESDPALYELRKAVDSGELGGIIDFCTSMPTRRYLLSDCKVPIAKYGIPDAEQMIRDGLEYLTKKGYYDIFVFSNNQLEIEVVRTACQKVIDEFITASPYKMKVTLEVMPSFRELGYKRFKEIWFSEKRPRAILLTNDCLFSGVWYAVMELGIKVPEELAIMTHLNKEREPMTHIPLTALEMDSMDFVREVFEELIARIAGKKYPSKKIQATIREGKTC